MIALRDPNKFSEEFSDRNRMLLHVLIFLWAFVQVAFGQSEYSFQCKTWHHVTGISAAVSDNGTVTALQLRCSDGLDSIVFGRK